MSRFETTVSRLRQPAYTGENRCLPCTIVNVAIAVVASVVLTVAASPVVGLALAAAVGSASFALSAATIALRGYLVPGTPTLTKRYMPESALRAFGKAPEPVTDGGPKAATQRVREPVDAQAVLSEAGALELTPDGDDVTLTDDFREAWRDAIDAVDTDTYEAVFALLDVDDGDLAVTETESDTIRFEVNGEFVGVWPSTGALLADVGGGVVLSEAYDDWETLDGHHRAEVAGTLRLFVERCPSCGGRTELGEETVETCCAVKNVMIVDCADCGARLFEGNL